MYKKIKHKKQILNITFLLLSAYLSINSLSNANAENLDKNNQLKDSKCFKDEQGQKVCVAHPLESNIDFDIDFNKRKIFAKANIIFSTKTHTDKIFFFFDPKINSIYLNNQKVIPIRMKAPGNEDWIFTLPIKNIKERNEIQLEYEVKNLTKWGFNWYPFYWKTDFSDSSDARFINMFAPASFEEDRYPMNYRFKFIGNKKQINLLTSGVEVKSNNNNEFKIKFDYWNNMASPYFDFTTKPYHIITFTYKSKYKNIPVTIYFKPSLGKGISLSDKNLESKTINIIKESLDKFENTFGAYAFNKLLVNLYSVKSGDLPLKEEYSMEYGGAIVSRFELIPHEICHQWFGRGASPKDGQAGFVDELICDWYDFNNHSKKVNELSKPTNLVGKNPFTLRTKEESYQDGTFFSEISWLFKNENQDIYSSLKSFYQKYRLSSYSKEDFINHLEKTYYGDLSLYFSKNINGNNIKAIK